MDTFGMISSGGQVLSHDELIKQRQRTGQCPTCGQKCFKKKLFKLEPITITGKVQNGRCLACNPLDPNKGEELVASCAVVTKATSRMLHLSQRRNMYVNANNAAAATASAASSGRGNSQRSETSERDRGVAASMPATRKAGVASNTSTTQPSNGRLGYRCASSGDYDTESGGDSSSRRERTSGGSTYNGGGTSSNSNHSGSRGEYVDEEYDLREEDARRDSQNSKSFLNIQTTRPSVIFLEGINIEDLWNDDDADDNNGNHHHHGQQHDHNNNNNRSQMEETTTNASTGGTKWNIAAERVSALTRTERQALQTLNSSNNSYLDIVNVMMINSLSATVQNEGLHGLSLIHDPDVAMLEECAQSCGFEVIVNAMGKCSKDAMAQTNACKVLFIASASSVDLQIVIGDAGGIEALVDAMKEFEEDVIVLEGCLLALSNLCIPEENLSFALEGELIELAVNAMSQNVDNCGLQEHGCAVLANLAVHEEARKRIRDCGGCDTVVVSMIVNPMDAGVQCQALVALRNLCVRDEENKVLLANAGAIDVIIQAMQNHRDDPQIQSRGSWALSIIGMNEDNKLYIGANGGSDVILRSMWVHEQDSGVQEKACRALWTLSVHPQNRYEMVKIDAIPAIIAAMQNHTAEPNIQERGCGVLCNLAAGDDKLKIQIVEEGALEVTVMAMVLHGENEMIQERAVALLFKLCIQENIPKMVNANISPMMAVVADNFPVCRERANYVLTHLQVS